MRTLLGYLGHHVLEACDGAQALQVVRSGRPDLVITDIFMPTMDGVEFVQRLQAEPGLDQIPVIFYSATYRVPEAQRLGKLCGVRYVIPKPSDPALILQTVNQALGVTAALPAARRDRPAPAGSKEADPLQSAALQLATFVDLGVHVAAQSDSARLLKTFCRAADNILNCRRTLVTIHTAGGQKTYCSDDQTGLSQAELQAITAIGERAAAQGRTFRINRAENPEHGAAPEGLPTLLVAPFATPSRTFGWLCLCEKLEGRPFSESDEQLSLALSTQGALAYGNIILIEELREGKQKLEERVKERTNELNQTVDVLQAEIKLRLKAEAELRAANAQLATRADQLRSLTGELTMAEQRERKRVSMILHDGLQQHLAIAKLQLGGVAAQLCSKVLRNTLEEIEKLLAESIQISRSLTVELSPPLLHEGGLAAGLAWLTRWMRDKHGLQVELSIEKFSEPPEDMKTLVFQAVRELLFNVLKHAKVSCAKVSLRELNGILKIVVSDEGTGFDTCQLEHVGENGYGFGLFSIRERISLIGGSFKIDSTPGKGGIFTLTVPNNSQASDISTALSANS